MTPNEAASALGVSRRTVERAIKSGFLRARQGNDRVWSIEPEAFDRWAEAHAPRTRQRMRQDGHARTPESHAQELRITQDRVAQLEGERDREREWRQEAQVERDCERTARAAAEAEGRERIAKVEAMLEREAARGSKAEARAEAAEAELVRLRERQDAVAAERWQEVSERLARLAPPPEVSRRGWWARWRRRAPG
jgi:excisionase family DNA binding protein